MAVRIVKEGEEQEQLIYAPEKMSICWNHLGGKKSVTEAQRKKLEKLFENLGLTTVYIRDIKCVEPSTYANDGFSLVIF